MLKTYTGSCHCGEVAFEVELDISFGTGKCNCSFCAKARLWTVKALPESFHLRSGEEMLKDYRGHNTVAHHLFCSQCGIRPFGWVDTPNITGYKYININVACMDDIDIDELMAAPITFSDGKHDQWDAEPSEIRGL